MAGSLDPGPPPNPTASSASDLSADGTHFVFGSNSKFEPEGNTNGEISIYDRNLKTEETHVVSKTPGGADDDRRRHRGSASSTSPTTARTS